MTELKPLNWESKPDVGMNVVRRGDGGMTVTFTDLSDATLANWHEFASDHLLGSDQRVRNLYDLRQVEEIPEKAIRMAVDLNIDPSTRNIRLAVVVSSDKTKAAIEEIAALSGGESIYFSLFTDIDEAEVWLSRPLDQIS
ncbi:MAG: hypothetical protein QGM50_01255 [Anaerolineae bacterium]|nr:hypothetical protein [Anaerolineae bacterium]MDK1080830.1 hypothetical protein [Anaerolineae bacterium]MDK1117394.1 hypothetical protein [Anaerolineae bacterium]